MLTIGFDLDLTLIDTRPGFRATLDALAEELGVRLPAEEMTRRLGPPLDHLLGPYLPAALVPGAVARFRELYVEHAVASVPVLPGAHEALAAVRRLGGRVLLVTGKFQANAELHVAHLDLDVDVVEGEVWGPGKAAVLRREHAAAYVGDHVHDVAGALAAGVLSVSVLTGGCTREELLEAGTDVVLAGLEDLPAWLTRWWSETEAARGPSMA